MVAFQEWLFTEERNLVDKAVLDGYDRAFGLELDKLIQRTKDPGLRKAFSDMRDCPIKDGSGHCRSWAEYIASALIRHGCHHTVNLDDALQYIVFRMLARTGERGLPSRSIFDFDETLPFDLRIGNPLEVIFKTYLMNDLRSVCSGKISRLKITNTPKGTVTIGGRTKDATAGTVSADEIPDKANSHEEELFQDIHDLLRRKSTPTMPLSDIWQAMLQGMPLKKQRQVFGHTKADAMRLTIKATLRDYATKTSNYELLRLLDKFVDFSGNKPDPNSHRQRKLKRPKKPKSNLPPDVQDYLSILDVIEKAGRRASSALLGKKRARWYERKPRNPNSPHKTRLHDVLARMTDDGVLAKHGAAYVPGLNYQTFKDRVGILSPNPAGSSSIPKSS